MSPEGLTQIVTIIAEEYRVEFSEDRLKVWAVALHDVTDEEGRAAVLRLVQTSPYAPKVADIRRMVFGNPADAERVLDEEAEIAVVHVERHLIDHRIVDLGPLLNAVVRAMGGPDAVVRLMSGEAWRYERARFKTLYRAYRRRHVAEDEAQALVPQAVAEALHSFPLEAYVERGLPIPKVEAVFVPAVRSQPVLPAALKESA